MQVKFHVPTLQDQQSAQELKEFILTSEPDAKVDADWQTQNITIQAEASAETFNELIVAAGHSINSEAES